MWTLSSGDCILEDGCISSPNFTRRHEGFYSCEVSIDPAWTGVVHVDFLQRTLYPYTFVMDGTPVTFENLDAAQLAPLHGMAPRANISFLGSGLSLPWKLCQVEALSPWWRVTTGGCQIDRDGCLETWSFVMMRTWDSSYCYWDECTVESLHKSEFALGVVESFWPEDSVAPAEALEVNGQSFPFAYIDDLTEAGVQRMVPSGTIRHTGCAGLKICPLSNCPAGSERAIGETACTDCPAGRFIDDLMFLCDSCQPGFFSDSTGQTQCQECAAGRYASSESQSACEVCPPGLSSSSTATVCADCPAGSFNDDEMLQCAACQPGFFSDRMGQTMCQECAAGLHASNDSQTACDACQDGYLFVENNVACQQCPPGTFLDNVVTCSPCEAGSFQHAAGQSECFSCSAILDLEGPNPHLWTTMRRTGSAGEWQEISGSETDKECGCVKGARVDAKGQCQECGEGLLCLGMGELEVLPGYFASVDSAGFVWRCHGADWARCPGGAPGSCAQHRLNSSTACEECEPFTRMTFDGPCQVRSVTISGGLKLPSQRPPTSSS